MMIFMASDKQELMIIQHSSH